VTGGSSPPGARTRPGRPLRVAERIVTPPDTQQPKRDDRCVTWPGHERIVTAAQASGKASVTIRPSSTAAPTDRHSRASTQHERYVPSVSRVTNRPPRARRSCAQRFVTRWRCWVVRPRERARDVPVVAGGGGSGGRTLLPPGLAAAPLARGLVVQLGRDARRSSANVRLPAAAQVHAAGPFVLDGLPGTTPAGHWPWSVEGRAFGACCFAGKLRSPAHAPGDAAHPALPGGGCPYADPYADPYARHSRTPSPAGRRITGGHAPEGGQSAAKPAADWPPSGEWSAPAARCASRD